MHQVAYSSNTSEQKVIKKIVKRLDHPIIMFEVGNGLHNQLMSFIDGMVVAILYEKCYDVVLPTMYGSMGESAENRSQPMELGDLYSATHFTECMTNYTRDLQIVETISNKDWLIKKISFTPMHDSRVINSENNWNSTHSALLKFAQPEMVVNIGRMYARWYSSLEDSRSYESRHHIIECLKPAPSIEKVVSLAVKTIRIRHPAKVTAIHPRLETDWKIHCEKHPSLQDCWIDEREWIARMKKSSKTESPEAFLMLGGISFNKTLFDQSGITVVTKYDLLPPGEFSSFGYSSSLAAIDFFLALEVDNVYGFMWSSMDVMIYEARLYKCLPMETIHPLGENWLTVVSGWT